MMDGHGVKSETASNDSSIVVPRFQPGFPDLLLPEMNRGGRVRQQHWMESVAT
jgi:hypothetical protein